MANPPLVWIVVLNWNGLADTLTCLESLERLRYPNRRIVVVDNGSTDGSAAALRRRVSALEIDIIETGKNLGYAGGNNVGIRHALERRADFLLVLNNDTTVDPLLLDELIAAAARRPAAGCFGPWIFYLDDPDRLWFTRSEWIAAASAFSAPAKGRLSSECVAESAATEYLCGAALFFRADVARKIGLLDERFFLVYEDADWCFRARQAGFECITVPSARVWHKIGKSFGSESSPLRTYFSIRNKLLWAEKNLERAAWMRILRRSLTGLYPPFALDRGDSVPTHKAIFWATRQFVRGWSIKLQDPQERANRRGVLDYVLRRFGDCPPQVRAWTNAWVIARDDAMGRKALSEC